MHAKNHISNMVRAAVIVPVISLLLLAVLPATSFALSGSSIASLTNAERTSRGLSALSWDSRLSASAYAKASDMCTYDYWAHTSPTGKTPWSFIKAAGYSYVAAGENLANGFSTDSGVVSAWMNSAGHRANILNTKFRDIGVAFKSCVLQGKSTTVVVAHYGATSTQASSPAPTAPSPTVKKPSPRPTQTSNPTPAPVTPKPVAATPSVASETNRPRVSNPIQKTQNTAPKKTFDVKNLKKAIKLKQKTTSPTKSAIVTDPFKAFLAKIAASAAARYS